MANPLKILTVLTASQAVKMEQGVDVNSQKVTNVANATESTDAVAYGQLTDVSGAIKSYVDAQDNSLSSSAAAALTAFSGAAATALAGEASARVAGDNAVSSSLKSYVDALEIALEGDLNTVSGALKNYIDAENDAQDTAAAAVSGAMKTYIDAGDAEVQGNLDAVSGALKSYVDAENLAQDTAVAEMSGAMKTYIDAGDAEVQGNLDAVSGALKAYVDSLDSVNDGDLTALSSSFKTYIDAENTAQDIATDALSSSLKGYVDSQDTALSGAFDTRITNLSGAAATALATEIAARIAGDATEAAARNTLSSSLKTYIDAGDAEVQGNLDAVSGALKAYIDTMDSDMSSSLKTYVDAADNELDGRIDTEAQARADADLEFLKLDGSRTMTGELKMGGQDIVNAKSGSFSGDVTVGGNLQVNGQLTYVNSVNLEVTDKLVTIAKGAANAAAADGAGIEVDGAGASFTYDNAASKWVSDIGLDVADEASFGGAMKLSGSAFTYIATPVVSNKYDVNDAIRALDTAVSGAVNAGSADLTSLKNKYDALRCVVTGTLSSGTVTVNLSTEGGAQFVAAELKNLALDVMMNDGSGYTNDLVAIKMFVDGSDVKVQIDAPATPSGAFRLIAVNEKDGGLN